MLESGSDAAFYLLCVMVWVTGGLLYGVGWLTENSRRADVFIRQFGVRLQWFGIAVNLMGILMVILGPG